MISGSSNLEDKAASDMSCAFQNPVYDNACCQKDVEKRENIDDNADADSFGCKADSETNAREEKNETALVFQNE